MVRLDRNLSSDVHKFIWLLQSLYLLIKRGKGGYTMSKNVILVLSVFFLAMVFCGTASAAEPLADRTNKYII